MHNRLIGGLLLITGTSIGGGMLALPLATAQLGFIYALFLLILCWAVMTVSALLILEVNLWHRINSNLMSMAKTTLGRPGQIITWFVYLLLLYALLAAYISGGSDFLQHLLSRYDVHLSVKTSAFLLVGVLSLIVYRGLSAVDYVNRSLMFSKLFGFILLVIFIFPFISTHYLLKLGHFYSLNLILTSTTVMITSFGFAIIVPSLRSYFHNDLFMLRKAILIGSLVPLFCYILWELTIMGSIPTQGRWGLITLAHSCHPTGNLMATLNQLLNNPLINFLAKLFTSLCFATSFLGVALSLFDFFSDGLHIEKKGGKKLVLYVFTFLPPLIIANHYPHVFITALSYAGILCAILLILLPAAMTWSGRYVKKYVSNYHVAGGRLLLFGLIVFSLFIISLPFIYT
ncbi:tryptophan/tyrosine permease [Rickettsiella grylli]|uniref:amino acid permease n=1 Tax=Rickettsiella grylli TaxID=59196 RepID=UPI0008FD5E42|nr:aromatic amino acid transport family protein [Rickettsiella grylli]OJA00696.1 tryptophan/tyrosine permease [Rickettsiella grylli]